MNNKYLLSISNNLQKKFLLLNKDNQDKILTILENIIHNNLLTSEVEKAQKEQIIYRINFGYKLEILATSYQDNQQNVVNILNIFDKSKLKRVIVFKEGIFVKIIDIDINFKQENESITNEIVTLFKSRENLKISKEDLESKPDNFYYFSLENLNSNPQITEKTLLSVEEVNNINQPLPLLLEGLNNSGKTTVSIIKAIQDSVKYPEETTLYLTNNQSNQYQVFS